MIFVKIKYKIYLTNRINLFYIQIFGYKIKREVIYYSK